MRQKVYENMARVENMWLGRFYDNLSFSESALAEKNEEGEI